MSLYNAEFFDGDTLVWRCATQFSRFKYKYDYLDWEKVKLSVVDIRPVVGDILLITGEGKRITGRVTDITYQKRESLVQFKPFNERLDKDIYMSMRYEYIEDYLKELIETEYINSGDDCQNIHGLRVNALTHTPGLMDYEEGIHNLYDFALSAFDCYGIVIEFNFDPTRKVLDCNISKPEYEELVIEADLPNVLEKAVKIMDYKEKTNKVTIYDEGDYSRHVTYYMNSDGTITTTPGSRLLPVTDKAVTVKVKESQATDDDGNKLWVTDGSGNPVLDSDNKKIPIMVEDWEEKALKKATSTLKAAEYKNLIEIQCGVDDQLIRPMEMPIGQPASIISDGQVYSSILTGYEFNDGVLLIFGTVRLQITKILKKKWRVPNGAD